MQVCCDSGCCMQGVDYSTTKGTRETYVLCCGVPWWGIQAWWRCLVAALVPLQVIVLTMDTWALC